MTNVSRDTMSGVKGAGALSDARMVTLRVSLSPAGQELALALPEMEWTKLVSDFRKMPADERQRVGVSIRNATAESPFPTDGSMLDAKAQAKCDSFVSDCILLAALAETVGGRVLTETAVGGYQLVHGNLVKPRLN